MSEIDQQFIEFVVKSLVGKPDAVQIKRTIDEKGVLLELTVDPEDLGRVIGKRGATAQSLRTLLRALGTKNDARYNLKIVDNGVGGHASDEKTEPKHEELAPVPTSDDNGDDNKPAESDEEEIAEEAAEVVEEEQAEPAAEEDDDKDGHEASDRLRKAREELADLDDLDV
jgi:uncharacterized protein